MTSKKHPHGVTAFTNGTYETDHTAVHLPGNFMTQSDDTMTKTKCSTALWYVEPGVCELQSSELGEPRKEEARVRALASGVSRGTERLVLKGAIPKSEWQRMRAPFQEGAFPFPVKYGYACAGIVEAGPQTLRGKRVFCLHPHQSDFNISAEHLLLIPDSIPTERAVLAANMETALNALWDGLPSPGDQICVVGGGVVGLLTGYLAARVPGTKVTLIDVNGARRHIGEELGLEFATPQNAPRNQDLVFHSSASAAGLQSAIKAAGDGATIIELSWYGDASVSVALGGDFHSRRLILKSSQVGTIPVHRQNRWSYKRRLETAMSLLDNSVLDSLLSHRIAFKNAPRMLPDLLLRSDDVLAPVIVYG